MELGNRPIAPVVQGDDSNLQQQRPGQSPQAQQDQYLGKMKFHLSNGDNEGFADEHQLVNDLRQVGYQPLGVSADGMTITIQGADGQPSEVSTRDVLEKMGWQVKGYQPMDVDHDHVSPELRYIIESPGIKDDDHAKQAVITSRLQRMGIKEPSVVGSGSDWYVFNPTTSQYIALTNKPGMDLSDLGEIGARAPGFLGSGVGAVLGTPADLVSGPVGTVAGAAGGGFLGNRLADLGAAALEPSYAGALRDRGAMENLKTVGGELATDSLAGLGGWGLGKLGGAGADIVRKGLASRLMQGAGGSAELAGKAVQGVADVMGEVGPSAAQRAAAKAAGVKIPWYKGAPRELGIAMADPTGVSMYGELAQLPQAAVRGGARALGRLGEADFAKSNFPGQAMRMRDLSARLLTRQGPQDTATLGGQFAETLGRGTAPQASEIGAEEILGNAGDMLGQKMARQRATEHVMKHGGVLNDARMLEKEAFEDAIASGMGREEAQQAGRQAGHQYTYDWIDDLARDNAIKTPSFGSLGRGIDNIAKVGQMGVKAAGVPYDAAMSGLRGGARALNYGGRGLRSLGEGLAPIETPMELKAGSEELMSRLRRRQTALQRQGYDRNIVPDTTLAQNP